MPAIFIQAIDQPIVAKMPLQKAIAFAAGLGLSMLSYSVHAAPASGCEAAHYTRNAEITASAQGRSPSAMVYRTLDEFIATTTGYEVLVAA